MVKEYYGEKGGLLIQELWQKGMGRIFGMRVMDTDVSSYLQRFLEKGLQVEEKGEVKEVYVVINPATTTLPPLFMFSKWSPKDVG